jgi:hypothetical protein
MPRVLRSNGIGRDSDSAPRPEHRYSTCAIGHHQDVLRLCHSGRAREGGFSRTESMPISPPKTLISGSASFASYALARCLQWVRRGPTADLRVHDLGADQRP